MPANLFLDLDSDKKKRILESGISEFAQYGYQNSSTNSIVKNCGISKGSLFKYFSNKEDFYFYILDNVTSQLISDLGDKSKDLPRELFKRVIAYAESEFAWYIQNPDKYKMILHAFTKDNTDIYKKTALRYGVQEQDIYYKLLENIDISSLKWDKQKTISILKWFLKGFNTDFISNLQTKDAAEIDHIRNDYVKDLTAHIELLKTGLTR